MAIFFAFCGFWINNYCEEMQSETLRLQTEIKRLEVIQKKSQEFERLKSKYPDIVERSEENLLEFQEYLPTELKTESFTDEIYRAADKNNISITSMQSGEPFMADMDRNFVGEFYKQSVKVQFEAEYVPTLNFLREIIDGKRFATLERISLVSAEEFLDCEAEFYIYSAKFVDKRTDIETAE